MITNRSNVGQIYKKKITPDSSANKLFLNSAKVLKALRVYFPKILTKYFYNTAFDKFSSALMLRLTLGFTHSNQ